MTRGGGSAGHGAAVAAVVVVFYVPERAIFYALVPFVSRGAGRCVLFLPKMEHKLFYVPFLA